MLLSKPPLAHLVKAVVAAAASDWLLQIAGDVIHQPTGRGNQVCLYLLQREHGGERQRGKARDGEREETERDRQMWSEGD